LGEEGGAEQSDAGENEGYEPTLTKPCPVYFHTSANRLRVAPFKDV